MSSSLSLTIDGVSVTCDPGTTLLEAAKSAGIDIPTLCWLPKHAPWASCLVCVVQIEGARRLVPACNTLAQDGMSVRTDSEVVTKQRKTALELLLSDHVGDCVAPCESVCPAHLDIPAMNLAILEGKLDEAARIVKDTIPLPATLGRICPTPCEGRCRRRPLDGAVSVCLLKRFVGDADLQSEEPYLPEVAISTGKRVAVVGAGPAGLSAAYFLRRLGHAVTIYDEQDEAGGALRTAVPEDRLPRAVLDAEIDVIRRMGVAFEMGRRVALDELHADAIVLALGPLEKGIDPGVNRTDKGIRANKGATNRPGVFACGAAVAPGKISVRAIGDAHATADTVHEFLTGQKPPETGFRLEVERNDTRFATNRLPLASTEARHDPSGDGFSLVEAQDAAARCLRCGCAKQDDCVLRDLANRYGASATAYSGTKRDSRIDDSHAEVVLEEGKCISCGICVRVAAEYAGDLGLAFHGRGFDTRIGGPFGAPLAEALKQAAKVCAAACPTGALYVRPEAE